MNFNLTASGKYLVFFNGSVIPCQRDTDCPGFAYCGLNLTWAALPDMCVCSYFYGLGGNQCSTVIPVWGELLFLLAGLIIVIEIVTVGYSIYDTLQTTERIRKKPFSAYSTTLIFNFLAACSLIGYEVGLLAQSKPAYSAFLPLSFFFLSSSTLNVSLVWIEIGHSSKQMSTKVYSNVHRYRNLLIAYYLITISLLILVAAVGQLQFAGYVAHPGILCICISYMIAYFRVKSLYQGYDQPRSSMNLKTHPICSFKSTSAKCRCSRIQ